jgi:hypothetical protein
MPLNVNGIGKYSPRFCETTMSWDSSGENPRASVEAWLTSYLGSTTTFAVRYKMLNHFYFHRYKASVTKSEKRVIEQTTCKSKGTEKTPANST